MSNNLTNRIILYGDRSYAVLENLDSIENLKKTLDDGVFEKVENIDALNFQEYMKYISFYIDKLDKRENDEIKVMIHFLSSSQV